MDSQKKQQLLEDVQSELSNHLDNSDPNSIDSKNAVNKQKLQTVAIAFTSNNTAPLTCGLDDNGQPVCVP
ncbi:hypothetical protein H6G91_29395 [Nostoc muscorum FACHB-395]|nr:hypothetical protein [Desmonostoc muscorum FACHB-395]